MFSLEQWDSLKTTIKHLYIDNNQTITDTSKYLGEHHGFKPTKRQLLRKLASWGFEKNVKRHERRAIITSEAQGFHLGQKYRGRRLDAAKLRRWRKREGIGADGRLRNVPQCISLQASSRKTGDLNSDDISQGPAHRSHDVSLGTAMELNEVSHVTVQHAQFESKAGHAEVLSNTFSESDIWMSVDVPGSPKLARLIGALTCFVDACSIPILDLGTNTRTEFGEPTKHPPTDDNIMDFELDASTSCATSSTKTKLLSPQTPGFWKTMSSNARNVSFTFRETSPISELSPFPTITVAEMSSGSVRWPHLTEDECITRLRRMKRKMMPDNELLEGIMDIAADYWNDAQYVTAELWYRRLVSAKQSILWFKPAQTLQTCLNVIATKRAQCRYKEAQELHEDLHAKIMQREWGEHDAKIKFRSLKLVADLLKCLGNYKEEEPVRRQVMQISLVAFGVRSHYTSSAMRGLGGCLKYRNQSSESEFLLYSTINIGNESILDETPNDRDLDSHFDLSTSMFSLAILWTQRGKLRDSRRLLEVAIQRHQTAKFYSKAYERQLTIAMAHNMYSRGQLMEAEKIVRDLLEQWGEKLESRRRDFGNFILGEVLSAQGHHAEAALCFEEVFQSCERMLGLHHANTMSTSRILGLCYVNQGLYRKALAHHRRTVDKLRLIADEKPERNARCIEKVQMWMSEITQDMLKAEMLAGWIAGEEV
ncbi:uncharacterized protein PAC_18530 [Phialocephala subalpina]|uniref:Clr5 domain-containing protein n=1 Tax=Phialocephala subalpina TaxID=576137 RepID=A0A1L7XUC1_9HELO|nr:uncharacterized protein PAC_18530 [Phialocephala subalpina]